MLYQLVHLWNQARLDEEKSSFVNRRMAQVVQRYFAEIYFSDLHFVSEGPLCAVDIDGVLESNILGFPSLTPASARSLRALNQHGNRVMLVTGRSIEELKERCAAYRLNGGVAEYGAVLFDQASGQVKELLTDEEQSILNKVRGRLSNKREIYLDNDYRYAIRAYRLDADGKRTHVDNESVEEILLETDSTEQVYAIQGISQTDFMVKRIDKGYGIGEWLVNFDGSTQRPGEHHKGWKPLALAVGDSATDLPMLNLAELAYAPANASWEVKQSEIPITSGSYQRGLEQAVAKYIRHHPGSCPACALEAFPDQTAFIQDIFAAQENGTIGMLWQAIKLFARSGARFHVDT
jgi:hydroxymethylpyrimidine pyrophosphatase-like HAD family hydrolase